MIFGRIRRRIDAIADEEANELLKDVKCSDAYFNGSGARENFELLLGQRIKARVNKECGSLIAMLLWTIISAVIQGAIKRWLERRRDA